MQKNLDKTMDVYAQVFAQPEAGLNTTCKAEYSNEQLQAKARPGHRRRRLPRLAPVRPADRGRQRSRCASTTSSPAAKDNIAHLIGQPALRADAARRDVSAVRRGRRDLQPRVPGLADPLPARPGADHQDQRAWRHQHAGPRQARARQDFPGVDVRGVRRSGGASADRGILGQRESDRPALLLRRRQALRRDAVLRLPPPAQAAHQGGRASSTPTARACIRTTAAWCPTSSCRRCRATTITIYGDGSQTRSFCYVDDLIDGFLALMATGDDVTGPINTRQSRRIHHARAGAEQVIDDHRLEVEDRAQAAAAGRSEAAPAGHHEGEAGPGLGAEGPAARKVSTKTIEYFDELIKSRTPS